MDAHRCFSRFWSVLAVVFFAAVTLTAQSTPAYAQDANPDVLNKVTKLNKKALDAYQKRDYDGARDFLKEALDLCKGSGLEKHPIRARTEVHIGIVLITGYKQRDAGIKHFKTALQIQPDIQLTKSVSTPALQDAFEEATVAQGGGGDDSSGGGAQASNDDNAGGGDSAGGDDNSAPRRRPPPKKKKKHSDDDDDSGAAVSKRKGDDDDGDDDDGGGTDNKGKIFIGLTGGSGFGIASGTGEMASTVKHTLASAGFAPAQLMQVAPEVGYFLSSNLLLSLQGRCPVRHRAQSRARRPAAARRARPASTAHRRLRQGDLPARRRRLPLLLRRLAGRRHHPPRQPVPGRHVVRQRHLGVPLRRHAGGRPAAVRAEPRHHVRLHQDIWR